MASKVVTVGEGAGAYDVLMEVEEGEDSTSASTVEKLPRNVAEKYSKADLVDYVSADEEDEGTDDA
jgi:hypothetical protein